MTTKVETQYTSTFTCDRCIKRTVIVGEKAPQYVWPEDWKHVELQRGHGVSKAKFVGEFCPECTQWFEGIMKELGADMNEDWNAHENE